jgi:hypothetical protein
MWEGKPWVAVTAARVGGCRREREREREQGSVAR